MADLAKRAEMRRRRILEKSGERMKKLLGPNAPDKTQSYQVATAQNSEPAENEHATLPQSAAVSRQLQEHTFRTMKSKRHPKEKPHTIWISDMVIFPIGIMTRLFPMCFVPVLICLILFILVQSSTSPPLGFWAVLACEYFGIDHRKSFAIKVLSLLERAFQIFLMFSFSFIVAQAVVLALTFDDITHEHG